LRITTEIRVLTGDGSVDRLGELARELGFLRTLLVADAGLARAGHLAHAHASLESAGVDASWQTFGVVADQLEQLREDVVKVRTHPLIGERAAVGGFLYDVDTGLLTQHA